MNYARNSALRLKLEPWRARLTVLCLVLMFAGLLARAAYLQGFRNHFLQAEGEARYERTLQLPANRGQVMDRNGELLAISLPVESIWASRVDLRVTPEQLKSLGRLLDLPVAEIQRKLGEREKGFVFIKRQISPELAAQVMTLGIPGIFKQREYKRFYPSGEVTAHLVGFTGVDEAGQEGLELAFQSHLSGKPGSRRVIRDRLGQIIEDVGSIEPPQQGKDLTLSLDAKLQYLAWRELKSAVEANKAKGGGLVILDVVSGEVLALVNQPDFNPNNRTQVSGAQTRNRTLTDTFEPGSTMKPFTAAGALEAGKFTPDTFIDTERGRLTIGRRTIHDAHREGLLTVAQVIQKSSNVGAAKMALSLPPEELWRLFRGLGFGAAPATGFPGEATGKVRPYKTWKPIEQATMAYGHGISVSLLQLARAYTVFATDGELRELTFLKSDAPGAGKPVLSAPTARAVRQMLEMVVQPGGTAPRAQVAGYRVGGKTGTARKQVGGRYAHNRYLSSFVGFAPASNPRLIVAVMIDEPSAGQYYGGTVAAPVFSAVMGGALRALGVPMDAPLTQASAPLQAVPVIAEEG